MVQLQILVATMGRRDLSLVEQMNIQCDAILANQTDCCCFTEEEKSFGRMRMISTTTRGVGLNRNIALLAASADIVLFADDDVIYCDGAPELVKAAFRENPKADVIVFSMDYTRGGQVIERRHLQTKRRHLWNAMRFGACAMAVRREAVLQHHLSFSQLFGGGCRFSAGEDSLFLRDCLRAGLRIYTHSNVLGQCSRDSSSWFAGYHEKYFYDKGALLQKLYPVMGRLLAFRYAYVYRKKSELSYWQRLKWIFRGLRGGKYGRAYEARKEEA